ncbi:Protein quaking-B, partial [Dissostichus eleginoides]
MVGETEVKERPKSNPDYLMQLMNDRKVMSSLPNFSGIFSHLERLLDEEIGRVRKDMYNDTVNGGMFNGRDMEELPEAVGPVAQLQEKLYVPVKEYPDFNFVGRILGPRGLTAKQLEAETGCKIMVRGKGSMRDKKKNEFLVVSFSVLVFGPSVPSSSPLVSAVGRSRLKLSKRQEEMNRGKPNWEHLSEDLHVLITVEDTHNRAKIKLQRAINEVKKLLVPAAEGEDNLKKMQLMELAILNGTYRDANVKMCKDDIIVNLWRRVACAGFPMGTPQAPRLITGPTSCLPPSMRNSAQLPTQTMLPLIRQIQSSALMQGANPHQALVQQGPESGIIYAPYDYPYTLTPSILEYPIDSTGVL